MTLKFSFLAVVGLALCPIVGLAQETPPNAARPARPTLRDHFKNSEITENAFSALLKIRTETRPDGSQVATVTNVSRTPLFYQGYGENSPRFYFEELQEGQWVLTGWHWCGTGLRQWKIGPGESRTLSLRKSIKGQKVRHWTIFSNAPDASNPKLPRVANKKQSLTLLNPEGV